MISTPTAYTEALIFTYCYTKMSLSYVWGWIILGNTNLQIGFAEFWDKALQIPFYSALTTCVQISVRACLCVFVCLCVHVCVCLPGPATKHPKPWQFQTVRGGETWVIAVTDDVTDSIAPLQLPPWPGFRMAAAARKHPWVTHAKAH